MGLSAVIKQLIDQDSRQAQTQTEPHDVDINARGIDSETQAQELPETLGECHRVRAVNEKPKKANPALQALIDLSNIELTEAQDADPDLKLIKDMLNDGPERPSWEQV